MNEAGPPRGGDGTRTDEPRNNVSADSVDAVIRQLDVSADGPWSVMAVADGYEILDAHNDIVAKNVDPETADAIVTLRNIAKDWAGEIVLLRELVEWLIDEDGITVTSDAAWFGERQMPGRLFEVLRRAI